MEQKTLIIGGVADGAYSAARLRRNSDVDCREFEYNGETYEVPPKEMLAEAILKTMFGQAESSCSCGSYELPKNLSYFFEGKKIMSSCSC